MVSEKIEKTNHVDPINALRAFTILAVFIAHSCGFTAAVFSYRWSFVFVMPAWMAMWVFYTLSGYLAGKGFCEDRYSLSIRGVGRYYYKKIIRIWLPTILFIFLACVLAFPDFIPSNPSVMAYFAMCIYGSAWVNPAVDGIGATWFVFTLMWLYFSAPIFAYIANKTKKVKASLQKYVLIAIIICCLALGMTWRLYAYFKGLSWSHFVYTPPYANVDLFALGFFFAYFKAPEKRPHLLKPVSVIALLTATFSCCLLLYHVWTLNDQAIAVKTAFTIYQYIYPSITVLLVLLYLYAFDYKRKIKNTAPSLQSIAENPARLIDAFAIISFEFYLFHSLILNRISNYLRQPYPLKEFLIILAVTFIISVLFAFAFHKAIDGLYNAFHLYEPYSFYKENRKVMHLVIGVVIFFMAIIILINNVFI